MIAKDERFSDALLPSAAAPPSGLADRGAMRVVGVLLVLGALRLIYTAFVPLDLVPDEAYYWDWSRQLDWGYYSKPPLVAWLIALATRCFGHTALVVRLPAVVLGTCGLGFVFGLARRMYGERAGWLALAASVATPGACVVSLLMTIDAPFLFCWTVTLFAWWRVLENTPRRAAWLSLAILATGAGALAKQTMLGFPPLLFVYLATSAVDRRELRRPAFWLWAVGSLLFLAPVVWWNSQHGWLTVQHTSEHFGVYSGDLWRHCVLGVEYVVGQMGMMSPLTYCTMAMVLVASGLMLPRLRRQERYLLATSGLPLAGVLLLAIVQRVQANWPAPFYVSAIILAAGWATGGWSLGRWVDRRRAYLRRGVAVGAACSLAVYVLPLVIEATPWVGCNADPTWRLRGWHTLGKETAEALARLPDPEHALVVTATPRTETCELAFYLPGQPRVYGWSESSIATSQYDVWGGPRGAEQRDALILTLSEQEVPSQLAQAFVRVEPIGELSVPLGGDRRHALQAWRGVQLRHWPSHTSFPHVASQPRPSERR